MTLIEKGELAAHTPGRRRRMITLDDALAYRAKRREAQLRAIIETSVDDYGQDVDPDQVADDLRRIRAEVAAKRRAAAG